MSHTLADYLSAVVRTQDQTYYLYDRQVSQCKQCGVRFVDTSHEASRVSWSDELTTTTHLANGVQSMVSALATRKLTVPNMGRS